MSDKHLLYEKDKLCLCSPASGLLLSAHRPRINVHSSGDFHLGLQIYLLRIDESGTPKVLLTERSDRVDISPSKFDQVAVQVLEQDEQSYDKALVRGLREELGIDYNQCESFSLDDIEFKIVKKYGHKRNLYNREYVKLFFVYTPESVAENISIRTPKLKNFSWLPFELYVNNVITSPLSYTKTAQFYILNPELLKITWEAITRIVEAKRNSGSICDVRLEIDMSRSEFYQYDDDEFSIIINESRSSILEDILLLRNGRLTDQLQDVLYHFVSDGKESVSLALEALCQNGHLYQWHHGESHKVGSVVGAELEQLISTKSILHNKIKCSGSKSTNGISPSSSLLKDHCRALETTFFKLTLNHYCVKKSGSESEQSSFQLRSNLFAVEQQDSTGSSNYATARSVFEQDEKSLINIKRDNNEIIRPKLHLVCMPGTFDPPHVGHLRVLADAMMFASQNKLCKTLVLGYLVPIGDKALGPDGQVWKPNSKKSFDIRHRMCAQTACTFTPVLQSTDLASEFPSAYGLELCLLLAQRLNAEFTSIIVGADTWEKWQHSFAAVLDMKTAMNTKTEVVFLIQPCSGETISITGPAKKLRVNVLEPKVPYFVHSSQILEQGLYPMTMINDDNLSDVYDPSV